MAVTKCVRLGDSPLIQNFISKQTNFSKAIKFLIISYCRQNKVVDLAEQYDLCIEAAVSQNLAMGIHEYKETKCIEGPVQNTFSDKTQVDDIPDVTTKPEPEKSEKIEIPDCYK